MGGIAWTSNTAVVDASATIEALVGRDADDGLLDALQGSVHELAADGHTADVLVFPRSHQP